MSLRCNYDDFNVAEVIVIAVSGGGGGVWGGGGAPRKWKRVGEGGARERVGRASEGVSEQARE